MAAHVHDRAAAGLFDVVEPVAVRPAVLFALAHLEDPADGPLVHELADPLVFGGKAKLLGVAELPLGRTAGGDHFVGLIQVEGQGFLNDDMFAGVGGGEHGPVMQGIGEADVHHVAAGLRDGGVQVGEGLGDAVFPGKGARASRFAGVNGHDLGVRHKPLVGFDVNIGDETGPEQCDFGLVHDPNDVAEGGGGKSNPRHGWLGGRGGHGLHELTLIETRISRIGTEGEADFRLH